jgi:hypothetical protein
MKQIAFLLVSLFFVVSISLAGAAVDVDISIGIPPPLEFAEAPDVVVVPSGTAYVYMVPDTPGLYFYNNYWYRFYGDHWYRSGIYNGPWVYIQTRRVPRFILDVPPVYYRHLPPDYNRIHYGDLHRHWRTWERGRHWNRYDWYKREFREHERRRHGEGHGLRDTGHGRPHDGHKPPHDGHKPPHDGHKPPHDGHKPPHDGHKPPHDGHKLGDTGGKKYDGGGVKKYGGTQKGDEGRKTHPDDRKGMEHKR